VAVVAVVAQDVMVIAVKVIVVRKVAKANPAMSDEVVAVGAHDQKAASAENTLLRENESTIVVHEVVLVLSDAGTRSAQAVDLTIGVNMCRQMQT